MRQNYQAVYFHVDHKPRLKNPTYSSVFVSSSLNNFVPSPYSKGLLQETQYRKNFDQKGNSLVSYQDMAKSQLQTKENSTKKLTNSPTIKNNSSIFSNNGSNVLSPTIAR